MGWSFSCNTSHDRKAVIAEITKFQERTDADGTRHTWNTLKHSARGGVLWYVMEVCHGDKAERFIGCSLIKSGGRNMGWGSKDMSESMGPCEVNCPLAYLDMVPDPGGYATDWRAKVRAYHAAQVTARKVAAKPGARIKLREPIKFSDGVMRDTFEIVTAQSWRGKMQTRFRADDGALCRISNWKARGYDVIQA